MKTTAAALVLALGLTASGALAQSVDPNSELGKFRQARAEGMKALDQNDPTGAMTALNTAGAILPDSPSILLLKAQVALKQRKLRDARGFLKDYLTRGYVLDLKKNPDFAQVWDEELNGLDEANKSPVGDMQVMSSSADFAITEGLAYAPDGSELYLSGIRTGTVTRLSTEGAKDIITFRPGVAAYGLGLRDGNVWATTVASHLTKGFDTKAKITSKIVVIDPVKGVVTQSFSDTTKTRRFGHMLMGKDDLYVADSEHGEVLRLAAYAGQLQPLVPEGYLDSPDALAENEGATTLAIADFVSGLYRVDLATGSLARIAAPADGSLLGISFMARYGNDLIAVQTGFKPNRILRLHMSDDWTQVTSVEVLLRSDTLLAQPTQGAVSGDSFVFVAKSQWDSLDDHGNLLKTQPDNAVIASLPLKP